MISSIDALQKELEEMYLEKAQTEEVIEYWEDRLTKCNARIATLRIDLNLDSDPLGTEMREAYQKGLALGLLRLYNRSRER